LHFNHRRYPFYLDSYACDRGLEPSADPKGVIQSSGTPTLQRFLQLQHSLSPRVLPTELGHNSRLTDRCRFYPILPLSFVIGYDFNQMTDRIPPHMRIYGGDPLQNSGLQSFSAPFNFELIHLDRRTPEEFRDQWSHSSYNRWL
jgi:hypothetical protein